MSADVDSGVERVIGLYDQYMTLQVREADSPAGADTFGVARIQMGETIHDLLDQNGLRGRFLGHIAAAHEFDAELDAQQTSGALTEEGRATARAQAPVEVKMGWIALGFSDELAEADQQSRSLPKVLDNAVEIAAYELQGQVLRFGDRNLSVLDTLAQPEATNEHWIDSRPIFGDDPVAAYVALYRGNPMLFLRAGEKNSCIRIVAGVNEPTGDKPANAKQVCEYLGLEGETTYYLVEIEAGIELVLRENLHQQAGDDVSAT